MVREALARELAVAFGAPWEVQGAEVQHIGNSKEYAVVAGTVVAAAVPWVELEELESHWMAPKKGQIVVEIDAAAGEEDNHHSVDTAVAVRHADCASRFAGRSRPFAATAAAVEEDQRCRSDQEEGTSRHCCQVVVEEAGETTFFLLLSSLCT